MGKKLYTLTTIIFAFLNTSIGIGQTQKGSNIETQESFSSFASSVDTSYDGTRVVVGAYGKSDWGFRVFEYDGNDWQQIGSDIDTEYPNTVSHYEVAISDSGNRVVVGAVFNSIPDFGKVRIFEFDGADWNQIGNTLIGESNYDFFGSRISMSSAGNRIIVGAKFNNSSRGNARIFEYNGVDWIQLGEDIDGDIDQFHFAESVSISDDGNVVAVGSNQFVSNDQFDTGLTRIFHYDGINWVQVGEDILGEAENDNFGVRISLSENGNRIVVGAGGILTRKGYAKVYDYDGSNWIQLGPTIYGDNIGDSFGRMVSLSNNGTRIAVGSPYNRNSNRPGLVKLYEYHNLNWLQLGNNILGDNELDKFGETITFSSDGNTLIVGALTYIYSQSGTEEGYAKVFDLSNLVLSTEEMDSYTFMIYPNPATNSVNISNGQDIKAILIYDSAGKLIKHLYKYDDKIDVSSFQNGLYIINIITNQDKKISFKLMKN